MRAKISSTLFLAIVLSAASARASNQPPHDFAHGVTCNSCHVPYAGMTDPAHWYVTSGVQGATSLTAAGATWVPDQWVGGVVTFTTGANQFKYRTITGNDATSVSWQEPLPPVVEAVTFQINKLGYDDVELKCKACHNPTGPVPGEVGNHFTGSAGEIGCGKCHEPHAVSAEQRLPSGGEGGGLIRA
jgi:hypothetical protein